MSAPNIKTGDIGEELRENMLGKSGPMSFINQLLDVIYGMGYVPTTWDILPIRLMCMMRETQELEEALEQEQLDDGRVEEEIADVLNYMVLTIHDLWGDSFSYRWQRPTHTIPSVHQSPAALTKPIRKELTDAFECWRNGNKQDVEIAVSMAFREVMLLAHALRTDVHDAMASKLEDLRKRGPTKKNINS